MAVIYVVEDDTNIQEIEAIALKNSGHKVYTFEDASHFYKKLEEKVPGNYTGTIKVTLSAS